MRKKTWKKTAAAAAMAAVFASMTGCTASISFDDFFEQFQKQPTLPEKLPSAQENEPSSVSTSSKTAEESSAQIEQAAESQTEALEFETEETTLDWLVFPKPPQADAESLQEGNSDSAWNEFTSVEIEGDGDVSWFTVETLGMSDHFNVQFHGAPNEESISNVRIAVWTEANGQDDIEWIAADSIGNETKVYPVYISNHNNETSGYILHVYYTNKAGEEKFQNHYQQISLQ